MANMISKIDSDDEDLNTYGPFADTPPSLATSSAW